MVGNTVEKREGIEKNEHGSLAAAQKRIKTAKHGDTGEGLACMVHPSTAQIDSNFWYNSSRKRQGIYGKAGNT